MPATMEKTDKNKVKVTMTVLPERIEEGLAYSYKRNLKSFKVNGFRPGHVPRNIVERYYGVEVLFEDAINYVYPIEFQAALKEFDLSPVSEPEVGVTEATREKFVITSEFYVKPEVELGQYKGLEIKKQSKEVTDEDLEKELARVAEMNSRTVKVEGRPAQSGDTVDIDYEGFVDGVAFEGGKDEGHSLKLGSGQFIPGFEDQLIGAEEGADVVVKVKFPEEYHAENLKGKDAEFKVHVNEIKETQIPEINDEFASDVSDFDTLDEYKADLRKKMEEQKARNADNMMKAEVREKATANATMDVPEAMIHNEIHHVIDNYRRQLANQGATLEDYLNMMGMTHDALEEQIRPGAEKTVKESLVIEAISKAENVECTDEDFDKKMDELAEEYFKGNKEELMSHVDPQLAENFREDIKFDKTVDLLLENAILKEEE